MIVNVPDGMTEQEVLDTIDRIVNVLAPTFKFSYYDLDDMRQEGRLFAMEALPKYKDELGSLDNFLFTHIRFRFMNLRRKRLCRITPPACDCDFCLGKDKSHYCEKREKWLRRNETKRSLAEPFDLEGVEEDIVGQSDISDLAAKSEVLKLVDDRLPVSLRPDFRRIIEGVNVPKQRRDKVFEVIKSIIRDYYGRYEEEDGATE